jgi:TRAP-type C4-dicarboxylate transport system permease large subunit
MEKCGMSHALVDFARALVGWVKGGLGMSVIVVAYFFSDICGSKMAEVSALGSTLMPPLTKAGYKRQDSASLIAGRHGDGHAGAAGDLHDRDRAGHQHLGGGAVPRRLHPAATIMVCLMVLVYFRARKFDWPVDSKPSIAMIFKTGQAARGAAGHPDRDPGRLLSRRLHRDRGRAPVVAGYAFFAAQLLLPATSAGRRWAGSPTTARS